MRNFRETSLTGLCQRTGSEKKGGHEMHLFLLLRFTQLNIERDLKKNFLKIVCNFGAVALSVAY